jgi:hypothetical protein
MLHEQILYRGAEYARQSQRNVDPWHRAAGFDGAQALA